MDRDGVGRKVTKERLLTDIYEIAKTSVGLPVGPVSDAVGMFHLVLGGGRGLMPWPSSGVIGDVCKA